MNITVLDLETSTHNPNKDLGESFSPYYDDNFVVYTGIITSRKKGTNYWFTNGSTVNCCPIRSENRWMLVGHNLKFDLQYLFKEGKFDASLLFDDKLFIWDTMVVAYLLSGHEDKFISLDDCLKKYESNFIPKDDKVKEFWDAGVSTEDIPKEIILPYLQQDVEKTYRIFKYQLAKAKEQGLLNVIKQECLQTYLLAEMEWNGIHCNRYTNEVLGKLYSSEINKVCAYIKNVMSSSFPDNYEVDPGTNFASDDIGLYLFGGELKYKVKKEMVDGAGNVVLYKSGSNKGKPRTKLTEQVHHVKGMYTPDKRWKSKKTGKWLTNDNILHELPNTDVVEYILEGRKLSKLLSTYVISLAKKIWPDERVHPKIHQTSTNTGRLSSAQPNMQNIPR